MPPKKTREGSNAAPKGASTTTDRERSGETQHRAKEGSSTEPTEKDEQHDNPWREEATPPEEELRYSLLSDSASVPIFRVGETAFVLVSFFGMTPLTL